MASKHVLEPNAIATATLRFVMRVAPRPGRFAIVCANAEYARVIIAEQLPDARVFEINDGALVAPSVTKPTAIALSSSASNSTLAQALAEWSKLIATVARLHVQHAGAARTNAVESATWWATRKRMAAHQGPVRPLVYGQVVGGRFVYVQ